MIITIISFIIASLFIFYFQAYSPTIDFSTLAFFVLIAGTAILFIMPLLHVLVLAPLQRLEQSLVSRLVDLFRKDKLLRFFIFYCLFFAFFSYALATALLLNTVLYKPFLFAGWLVAFGLALDFIRNHLKRVELFLNPFHLIQLFVEQAKRSIQDEKDTRLWDSLDSLSEMALQATEKSKIALSAQTLSAFPPIMNNFFTSAKSISHLNQDQQIKAKTGQDEASYTVFYLLQRLQAVYDKALSQNLETVCTHLVTILGKIIVYSARFDLSMVSFPVYFLGRCALKAQKHNLDEVANMSTSALLEISRTILTDMNLSYMELQEPFEAIISQLDAIAKETFRKNKTTNIKLLMQPLQDLKLLFQTEKMANHPDTPVIIQSIDNALIEFETLEQVMRTMPPLSTIMESEPNPPAL